MFSVIASIKPGSHDTAGYHETKLMEVIQTWGSEIVDIKYCCKGDINSPSSFVK